MSGHSKWHNIQKTKGAQDAKRAAAFTKIAKEMYVAVKEGGGSTAPSYNSRLATVITKAKAANMPNDNIKRVLEKAANAGSGDSYESITYEGYGPSGIAVSVETMTDSRNRTAVVEHEATTSKISDDQLFYCNQRGLSTEDAVGLIVNGYAREVLAKLPMEFAGEAQKLLSISLEGSVG